MGMRRGMRQGKLLKKFPLEPLKTFGKMDTTTDGMFAKLPSAFFCLRNAPNRDWVPPLRQHSAAASPKVRGLAPRLLHVEKPSSGREVARARDRDEGSARNCGKAHRLDTNVSFCARGLLPPLRGPPPSRREAFKQPHFKTTPSSSSINQNLSGK